MNKKIKKLWVAALKSDTLNQGKGKLCQVDPETGKRKQCCLGVLSDLAVMSGVIPAPEMRENYDGDGQTVAQYGELPDAYFLPREVQEWAELSSNNPTVAGHTLSLHNDGDSGQLVTRKSFSEIADLIKEHL